MGIRLEPKTWRYVLLAVLVLGSAYFLFTVRVVLAPFVGGMVLAFVLHPLVAFWERRGVGRTTAILMVYAALGGILTLLVVFGLPRLMTELNELARSLPVYLNDINAYIDSLQGHYDKAVMPNSVRQVIDETVIRAEQGITRVLRGLTRSTLGLFSQLLSIVFAPILAFYILKDADAFRAKFLGAFPNTFRGDAYALLREIGYVMEHFVRGELLVSTIIGVLTALGMFVLGVKYALMIGLIAGIAELVPYFGPFIGAIPAIGFALLKSKTTAIYAALVILVVQQLEGNLISPVIMGESMGLHPLWIIFALLAGGELFGILGLILAVPVAGIIRVVGSFLFRKLMDWDIKVH